MNGGGGWLGGGEGGGAVCHAPVGTVYIRN